VARGIRKAFGVDISSELVRQLTYGRVVDTTRMRRDLGFEPRFTTREAFADYVRGRRFTRPVSDEVLDAAQQQVLQLTRRLESGVRRLEGAVNGIVGATAGSGGRT
jgi:UDP-glucose 4-epimerase